MSLTARQRGELHRALLAYAAEQNAASPGTGWDAVHAALGAAVGDECRAGVDEAKHGGLLAKKWVSVVRLQKKVMELERRLESAGGSGGGGLGSTVNGTAALTGRAALPRAPSRATLQGHRDGVTAVAFHPRWTLVASTSQDGSTRVWDHVSGQSERVLKGHTNAVHGVAWGGDQWLCTASADTTLKLWDTQTWDCVRTLRGHDHAVSAVAFTAKGDLAVSASRDKTARVWDCETGFERRKLTGHEEWVRCVSVSADGTRCITGSSDQTVRVWDTQTGHTISVMAEHDHVVEAVALSPAGCVLGDSGGPGDGDDGKKECAAAAFAASASRDKTIKVFDATNGACLMTLKGHDNWVRAVQFLPDGRHLISCSDDKSVRVWDLEQQRCIRTLDDAHDHFVSCLDYQAQERLLATGSVDSTVRIWGP